LGTAQACLSSFRIPLEWRISESTPSERAPGPFFQQQYPPPLRLLQPSPWSCGLSRHRLRTALLLAIWCSTTTPPRVQPLSASPETGSAAEEIRTGTARLNGLGGRGDSDGDGAFDVADVIQSLDVVAGIASSTPETLHRFDLYPYPDGDSEIDVRDLTVQIQAILHSAWPDGAPLPAVIPAPVSGKGGNASASLLAQGASLFLDTNTPIRGFQLEFRMRSQPVSPLAGKSGLSVSSHFDAESMTYRTLMFTNHNELLPAGKHSILDGIDQQAEFISGIVVTDAKEKLNIYTLGGFSTPVEIPISQRSSEIEMYPNPVSISGGSKVSLKFAEALKEETGEAEVEIVDLLGRALLKQALTKGQLIHEIDLSKVVRSPGIHFVRIHSGLSLTVMPFLVVP